MNLAWTFFLSLAIVALGVLLLDVGIFSISETLSKYLAKYVDKKMSADGYPLAVFLLLLTSAATELMLLFKLNVKWLSAAKEKTKRRVVKIGGGLLGGLICLTVLTYKRGNFGEAKLGVILTLTVLIYIAAPLFIVSVLHMLREPDSNPMRMRFIKWVAALSYIAIAIIAIWGIIKTVA